MESEIRSHSNPEEAETDRTNQPVIGFHQSRVSKKQTTPKLHDQDMAHDGMLHVHLDVKREMMVIEVS